MSRRPEFAPVNPPDHPLQSGGGGGTYDGMEARVAVIETHIDYIRQDIGEMRTDIAILKADMVDVKVGLATLTERVSHLPDKGFFVKSLILTATVLGGLMTFLVGFAAFQDHIRAFFSH